MDYEQLKDELRSLYMDFYVEGFKQNDVSIIDKIVRYPIAYIKMGQVEMRDSYPVDPKALKEETGWDHSVDWKFDIPALNESSAHAIASATRCRADGSVIEHVHGFYAFTRVDGEWKMYALADTTF